jgi:GNAT superfamily N-acetyltransferase
MTDPAQDAERAWRGLLRAFRALPDLLPGGSWKEDAAVAVSRCPSVPVPFLNGVWLLGDADVGKVLTAVASLEAEQLPAPIIVREGRSTALEAGVPDLGLQLDERIPLMVAGPGELRFEDVDGVELAEVTEPKGWSDARLVAEAGFGTPAALLSALYAPPLADARGFGISVARSNGVAVSTAQTFQIDDVVGIYSVATPPEHRGRGYGGALTAWVTARAFAAGATFAYLQSSAMGVSVYRRIGFLELDSIAIYTRAVSAD